MVEPLRKLSKEVVVVFGTNEFVVELCKVRQRV